uniref:Uncharacterized protein n=1 Tax=viral metagenome TaxID=1070528 RepID=A0A6C0B4G2_9ZZZZ
MGLTTLVRVTQFNVKHYVGFECIYNHGRGRNKSRHIATITKTSKSGKSISIDDPNWPSLQTVSREIYIIV